MPVGNDEDEEERGEALAAFRAGQEYELRKVTNWIKSTAPSPEKRLETSSSRIQTTIINTATTGLVLPTIMVVPPSISNTPSATTLPTPYQFTTFGSTRTTDIAPIIASETPTISLAPVTTVTWSAATPIVAVQPLSTTKDFASTVTQVSSADGIRFAPKATTAPVEASTSNDVSVNVTLPLPLSSEDPSTSMTFRLPTTTMNSISSSSATAPGFNFTFTGQPASTGQFSFGK